MVNEYTYTSFGAMATKTDGRGVVITYGYDTLNRLTSISYNTSNAPTVVPTPNVTYTYDNNQSSSTKGLLLSLSAGGYSESYGYDSFKRVQSITRTIDGRNYTTSYQFNTANQPTQMTYPSGRVVNVGHDSKGRLTSVGPYLTSVTYNGIGQLTGTSLGNGVSESYGYDPNRMQLTSQIATKSGGPTGGLMNLTYGYQATAGQMGAGSTAGNAGQLMTISNSTINGTTESAGYTYDNLGRLVTSNQTSNGTSAQRRFAYDRWGNRTGMWDAISGGNQLQNIVIDGANHIWSVNSSTSDPNYYYDPAGNLVWAAGHSYNYDAENRQVCLDGCATGQYAYDPTNRRYKKVSGGATTHYIWEGSQVIAECDGSTGAITAEYVYSGGRMIAKIASGTTQYFLSDRLSTRLALDAAGNLLGRQGHLPFGEDFGESGSQEKHHFTGYERDGESATDYAVNRQYTQDVGRFLRPDPFGGSSDLGNPQSLNRYTYVQNDPINASDPLGLCLCVKVPMGEKTEVNCFLCNDPPPRQRTREPSEHRGGQNNCKKLLGELKKLNDEADEILESIFKIAKKADKAGFRQFNQGYQALVSDFRDHWEFLGTPIVGDELRHMYEQKAADQGEELAKLIPASQLNDVAKKRSDFNEKSNAASLKSGEIEEAGCLDSFLPGELKQEQEQARRSDVNFIINQTMLGAIH